MSAFQPGSTAFAATHSKSSIVENVARVVAETTSVATASLGHDADGAVAAAIVHVASTSSEEGTFHSSSPEER